MAFTKKIEESMKVVFGEPSGWVEPVQILELQLGSLITRALKPTTALKKSGCGHGMKFWTSVLSRRGLETPSALWKGVEVLLRWYVDNRVSEQFPCNNMTANKVSDEAEVWLKPEFVHAADTYWFFDLLEAETQLESLEDTLGITVVEETIDERVDEIVKRSIGGIAEEAVRLRQEENKAKEERRKPHEDTDEESLEESEEDEVAFVPPRVNGFTLNPDPSEGGVVKSLSGTNSAAGCYMSQMPYFLDGKEPVQQAAGLRSMHGKVLLLVVSDPTTDDIEGWQNAGYGEIPGDTKTVFMPHYILGVVPNEKGHDWKKCSVYVVSSAPPFKTNEVLVATLMGCPRPNTREEALEYAGESEDMLWHWEGAKLDIKLAEIKTLPLYTESGDVQWEDNGQRDLSEAEKKVKDDASIRSLSALLGKPIAELDSIPDSEKVFALQQRGQEAMRNSSVKAKAGERGLKMFKTIEKASLMESQDARTGMVHLGQSNLQDRADQARSLSEMVPEEERSATHFHFCLPCNSKRIIGTMSTEGMTAENAYFSTAVVAAIKPLPPYQERCTECAPSQIGIGDGDSEIIPHPAIGKIAVCPSLDCKTSFMANEKHPTMACPKCSLKFGVPTKRLQKESQKVLGYKAEAEEEISISDDNMRYQWLREGGGETLLSKMGMPDETVEQTRRGLAELMRNPQRLKNAGYGHFVEMVMTNDFLAHMIVGRWDSGRHFIYLGDHATESMQAKLATKEPATEKDIRAVLRVKAGQSKGFVQGKGEIPLRPDSDWPALKSVKSQTQWLLGCDRRLRKTLALVWGCNYDEDVRMAEQVIATEVNSRARAEFYEHSGNTEDFINALWKSLDHRLSQYVCQPHAPPLFYSEKATGNFLRPLLAFLNASEVLEAVPLEINRLMLASAMKQSGKATSQGKPPCWPFTGDREEDEKLEGEGSFNQKESESEKGVSQGLGPLNGSQEAEPKEVSLNQAVKKKVEFTIDCEDGLSPSPDDDSVRLEARKGSEKNKETKGNKSLPKGGKGSKGGKGQSGQTQNKRRESRGSDKTTWNKTEVLLLKAFKKAKARKDPRPLQQALDEHSKEGSEGLVSSIREWLAKRQTGSKPEAKGGKNHQRSRAKSKEVIIQEKALEKKKQAMKELAKRIYPAPRATGPTDESKAVSARKEKKSRGVEALENGSGAAKNGDQEPKTLKLGEEGGLNLFHPPAGEVAAIKMEKLEAQVPYAEDGSKHCMRHHTLMGCPRHLHGEPCHLHHAEKEKLLEAKYWPLEILVVMLNYGGHAELGGKLLESEVLAGMDESVTDNVMHLEEGTRQAFIWHLFRRRLLALSSPMAEPQSIKAIQEGEEKVVRRALWRIEEAPFPMASSSGTPILEVSRVTVGAPDAVLGGLALDLGSTVTTSSGEELDSFCAVLALAAQLKPTKSIRPGEPGRDAGATLMRSIVKEARDIDVSELALDSEAVAIYMALSQMEEHGLPDEAFKILAPKELSQISLCTVKGFGKGEELEIVINVCDGEIPAGHNRTAVYSELGQRGAKSGEELERLKLSHLTRTSEVFGWLITPSGESSRHSEAFLAEGLTIPKLLKKLGRMVKAKKCRVLIEARGSEKNLSCLNRARRAGGGYQASDLSQAKSRLEALDKKLELPAPTDEVAVSQGHSEKASLGDETLAADLSSPGSFCGPPAAVIEEERRAEWIAEWNASQAEKGRSATSDGESEEPPPKWILKYDSDEDYSSGEEPWASGVARMKRKQKEQKELRQERKQHREQQKPRKAEPEDHGAVKGVSHPQEDETGDQRKERSFIDEWIEDFLAPWQKEDAKDETERLKRTTQAACFHNAWLKHESARSGSPRAGIEAMTKAVRDRFFQGEASGLPPWEKVVGLLEGKLADDHIRMLEEFFKEGADPLYLDIDKGQGRYADPRKALSRDLAVKVLKENLHELLMQRAFIFGTWDKEVRELLHQAGVRVSGLLTTPKFDAAGNAKLDEDDEVVLRSCNNCSDGPDSINQGLSSTDHTSQKTTSPGVIASEFLGEERRFPHADLQAAKDDISDAFRWIGHKLGAVGLFASEVGGFLTVHLTMIFGSGASPGCFDVLGDAVVSVLKGTPREAQKETGEEHPGVDRFVDDFFSLVAHHGTRGEDHLQRLRAIIVRLFGEGGHNLAKQGETGTLSGLQNAFGVMVDCVERKFKAPWSKVVKLNNLVKEFAEGREKAMTYKTLASCRGLMYHVTKSCQAWRRLVMPRLDRGLESASRLHPGDPKKIPHDLEVQVNLAGETVEQGNHMLRFVLRLTLYLASIDHGVLLKCDPEAMLSREEREVWPGQEGPEDRVSWLMDSSGKVLFLLDLSSGRYIRIEFTAEEQALFNAFHLGEGSTNINIFELWSEALGIVCLGLHHPKKIIDCINDNTAAQAWTEKGRHRSSKVDHILAALAFSEIMLKQTVQGSRIGSGVNFADIPTRIEKIHEFAAGMRERAEKYGWESPEGEEVEVPAWLRDFGFGLATYESSLPRWVHTVQGLVSHVEREKPGLILECCQVPASKFLEALKFAESDGPLPLIALEDPSSKVERCSLERKILTSKLDTTETMFRRKLAHLEKEMGGEAGQQEFLNWIRESHKVEAKDPWEAISKVLQVNHEVYQKMLLEPNQKFDQHHVRASKKAGVGPEPYQLPKGNRMGSPPTLGEGYAGLGPLSKAANKTVGETKWFAETHPRLRQSLEEDMPEAEALREVKDLDHPKYVGSVEIQSDSPSCVAYASCNTQGKGNADPDFGHQWRELGRRSQKNKAAIVHAECTKGILKRVKGRPSAFEELKAEAPDFVWQYYLINAGETKSPITGDISALNHTRVHVVGWRRSCFLPKEIPSLTVNLQKPREEFRSEMDDPEETEAYVTMPFQDHRHLESTGHQHKKGAYYQALIAAPREQGRGHHHFVNEGVEPSLGRAPPWTATGGSVWVRRRLNRRIRWTRASIKEGHRLYCLRDLPEWAKREDSILAQMVIGNCVPQNVADDIWVQLIDHYTRVQRDGFTAQEKWKRGFPAQGYEATASASKGRTVLTSQGKGDQTRPKGGRKEAEFDAGFRAKLEEDAQEVFMQGKKKGTLKDYDRAMRHWAYVADQFGWDHDLSAIVKEDLKEAQQRVLKWLIYERSFHKLKASSIRGKLSGVRWWHLSNLSGNPFEPMESVSQWLKDLQKVDGPAQPKLPVPITLLELIFCFLSTDVLDDQVMKTALLVGYWFMLRSAEYLAMNSGEFDPGRALTWNDIRFSSEKPGAGWREISPKEALKKVKKEGRVRMTLTLYSGKNSLETCTRSLMSVKEGEGALCPVKAMLELREKQQEGKGRLGKDSSPFQREDGKVLTRNQVSDVLKAGAACLNVSKAKVASHSLRRGGASAYAANQASDEAIQRFGRWTSDAYKAYVFPHADELDRALRRGVLHVPTFERN